MSAAEYYNGQSGQKGYQEMNNSNDRGYNGGYNNNNGPSYPDPNNYGQQQQQQPYYAPPQQDYPLQQQNGQQYMPPNSVPPVAAMHSSQPYAEPQYAANMNPDIAGKANPAQAEHRFKPKKKINDPIFLVLFIATFAGMIVVAALAIRQFVKYNGGNGGFGDNGEGGTGISTSLNYHTVYLLIMASALALLLSAVYLLIVRTFTKALIEITLALSVLLNIAVCVYYFTQKYWSGAIIFLVISIVSVLSYFFMRKRIPLARIMLQTIIDVSKHHPSVYAVCMISLIVQTAFSVFYSFAAIAVYVTWTPGNPSCATNSCSSGKVAGLIFYLTFAYIWTSQVLAAVTLMTLAGGVYGQWYYNGPNAPQLKGANRKAFGRAATTSLGSVAFGSLIVTVLEIIKQLLNALSRQEAAEGDAISAIFACIAACCVSCISSLVQYFNKYAYIEIALYGKSYIPAAKDAWRLLKHRGIDALVNDNLISITLTFGAYIVGLLTALFAYLYLRYTDPAYNRSGEYTAPVMLFGALIGINAALALASALESGVSTIFVGLGEDPYVLQERSPGLFEEIRQNYPQVVQPIGP